MTPYDRGFLSVFADAGLVKRSENGDVALSPESLEAIDAMLRAQQDERDFNERARKARRARNRTEQIRRNVRNYVLGLGFLGGLGGAWTGSGTAAGFPLMLAGAALGTLGGRALGSSKGNDIADYMERMEDETGIDADAQKAQEAARNERMHGMLGRRLAGGMP